jgi:hypothetical protein
VAVADPLTEALRRGARSTGYIRTRLGEAGFDAFTIAALMGHSQIQTTARYVRATERNKRAVVEAVMLNSEGGHKLDTTQKRPDGRRKLLAPLVAGGGIEPPTLGL